MDILKNTDAEAKVAKQYEMVRSYDQSQIDAHAAKCGGHRLLKEIIVTTDDDYQFYYLVKRPSKNVLMAIADKKKGAGKDAEPDADAIQKLLLGLVLEGDMQTVENDGAVFQNLIKKLGELARTGTAEIKKI